MCIRDSHSATVQFPPLLISWRSCFCNIMVCWFNNWGFYMILFFDNIIRTSMSCHKAIFCFIWLQLHSFTIEQSLYLTGQIMAYLIRFICSSYWVSSSCYFVYILLGKLGVYDSKVISCSELYNIRQLLRVSLGRSCF